METEYGTGRVCPGPNGPTDNATLEVGWHFCASVYPVVKWGDKTGPNLQEVKEGSYIFKVFGFT